MPSLKNSGLVEKAVLHLRDGNEELMYASKDDGTDDLEKPQRVWLFGPGSKRYAKAKAAAYNRNMDRMKAKGKSKMTADEQIAETAQFLTDCTDTMENITEGELAGPALYTHIYSDLEICFVPLQIDRWLAETANFTKPSPAV